MRDWLITDSGRRLLEKHWKAARRDTAEKAIRQASLAHGVAVDVLMGPSRVAKHVRARWHAARLMRKEGMSLPQIGRALNRHYTSILAGLRALDSRSNARKMSMLRSPQSRQYLVDAPSKGSV